MEKMVRGRIYTKEQIQIVWKQFHKDCNSVVWPDDNGQTWNDPPSIDQK